MKSLHSFIMALVFISLIIFFSAFYVVNEGEQAIIVRLGEVVQDSKTGKAKIRNPGLHVKIPVVDQAKIFDVRIQGLSSKPSNVLTLQQTFLSVDYYVKWRITDLALFYKSTNRGNVERAEQLLEQSINDIVRSEFGTHSSNQMVSSERNKVMASILAKANALDKVSEMGFSIIDVRLQSVVLPQRVLKSVFERMASERKQFAENARAEGNRIAEGRRALADQQVVIIREQAKADAATIRAEGEKQAAVLYAETYSKDPEFYSFYRSLEAYEASFSHKGDILVLKPDSQFFHYFNDAGKSQ